MIDYPNFVACVLLSFAAAFGLGIGVTALSYRKQIRYYRRMAGKWWRKAQALTERFGE